MGALVDQIVKKEILENRLKKLMLKDDKSKIDMELIKLINQELDSLDAEINLQEMS